MTVISKKENRNLVIWPLNMGKNKEMYFLLGSQLIADTILQIDFRLQTSENMNKSVLF